MTAKEFKKINKIPDDKNLTFGCSYYWGAYDVIKNKREMAKNLGCSLKDFNENFPEKDLVMISFTN